MLIEQVVEVDLPEYLGLEALVDGLGLQLVLEDSHLHQEQRDHPLLHQHLESALYLALPSAQEQLAEALLLQQVLGETDALVLQLPGEALALEVLDDLAALSEDVGDEVEHLEF